jgi:deazaflavin-dependent oxidoreductase (nitroreductase family)
MTRALRFALGLPVWLYRWRLGRLLGHRFLLLVHRGRRTGRTYETVLEVVRWDAATGESIVMSGFGRRASWFRNVEAGGALEIRIAGSCVVLPRHRVLELDEAAAVLAGYERRNRIVAPVVRAVLGRLSRTGYDGSDAARARVVAELPLVAFRPRATRDPPAVARSEQA